MLYRSSGFKIMYNLCRNIAKHFYLIFLKDDSLLCVNTISSGTFMKIIGISSGFFYNSNFCSTKYLSTVNQKKETTFCLEMLRQENQQNYSQKYPISNLKTTSYLCFMFFFRAHLAVVLAQELLKSATRVNDIV